jgi:hypothetical protein
MAFPGMPGMGGMGGAAGMDEEAMKQQMIIKYVRSASQTMQDLSTIAY